MTRLCTPSWAGSAPSAVLTPVQLARGYSYQRVTRPAKRASQAAMSAASWASRLRPPVWPKSWLEEALGGNWTA